MQHGYCLSVFSFLRGSVLHAAATEGLTASYIPVFLSQQKLRLFLGQYFKIQRECITVKNALKSTDLSVLFKNFLGKAPRSQ